MKITRPLALAAALSAFAVPAMARDQASIAADLAAASDAGRDHSKLAAEAFTAGDDAKGCQYLHQTRDDILSTREYLAEYRAAILADTTISQAERDTNAAQIDDLDTQIAGTLETANTKIQDRCS